MSVPCLQRNPSLSPTPPQLASPKGEQGCALLTKKPPSLKSHRLPSCAWGEGEMRLTKLTASKILLTRTDVQSSRCSAKRKSALVSIHLRGRLESCDNIHTYKYVYILSQLMFPMVLYVSTQLCFSLEKAGRLQTSATSPTTQRAQGVTAGRHMPPFLLLPSISSSSKTAP